MPVNGGKETGGRYFEMEYICQPFTGKYAIPPHYRPAVTERFEIIKGKARYMLAKAEKRANSGETVLFPAGIEHIHPWSDSELTFACSVKPIRLTWQA